MRTSEKSLCLHRGSGGQKVVGLLLISNTKPATACALWRVRRIDLGLSHMRIQ